MTEHLRTVRPDSNIGRSGAASGAAVADTPPQRFYGLVELDAAGTVLYSRVGGEGARPPGGPAQDVTGQNFFTEVAPFKNVEEFRRHLDEFGKGSQPATSLDFVCEYEDGPLPVRILLARIRERTSLDVTKSVLVHIRKVQ